MYYKTGGLVTTTADLSTIQIPAYDVYVTVNDGHTSVGQKSLSIHVFSKYNVCNMKRKFMRSCTNDYTAMARVAQKWLQLKKY
jgi:hypothetical protein